MGHPMRLEPTREGLLVQLINHYATRGDTVFEINIKYVNSNRSLLLISCERKLGYFQKKEFNLHKMHKNQ